MSILRFNLILILLLIIFQGTGCKKDTTGNGNDEDFTDLSGEYLGQAYPGMVPVQFAPGILQASENWWWHGSPVFSPDGTLMFFGKYVNTNPARIEIKYMKLSGDNWTYPQNPSFASGNGYNNPVFSNDGNRLYFIAPDSREIFYVEKGESGWSERKNINISIPASFNPGWQFSITKNGNLYFELWQDGDVNIYVCKYENGSYSSPEKLGAEINTTAYEWSPYIHPDEEYIIFASNRAGGYGMNDLYICFQNTDGTWTDAENMGNIINTASEDAFPFVTYDGEYFFFVTQKTGDIGYNPYWVDAGVIDDLRPQSEPSGPLDGRGGGIIAFTSDRDGGNEIYVMNADGSEQTRITNDSYEDFFPRWSPDGSKLSFCSSRGGGFKTYIIDVIDIENGVFSEPYLLVDLPGPASAWSPDGMHMALLSDHNGIFRVFLVDTDGNNLHMLENIDFGITDIDWSPDGDRFAVTADNEGLNIGIVNIDGTNFNFLTSAANSFAPAWSPDGTEIAFHYGPGSGQIDVYIINADGTNLRRITTYNNHDEFPRWSPDGSRITYESERNGFEKVYIINADGTNPVQLTNSGANDGGPDWRPESN